MFQNRDAKNSLWPSISTDNIYIKYFQFFIWSPQGNHLALVSLNRNMCVLTFIKDGVECNMRNQLPYCLHHCRSIFTTCTLIPDQNEVISIPDTHTDSSNFVIYIREIIFWVYNKWWTRAYRLIAHFRVFFPIIC